LGGLPGQNFIDARKWGYYHMAVYKRAKKPRGRERENVKIKPLLRWAFRI
jgi:hypothetical protein